MGCAEVIRVGALVDGGVLIGEGGGVEGAYAGGGSMDGSAGRYSCHSTCTHVRRWPVPHVLTNRLVSYYYSALMSTPLPDLIDLWRLADANERISGEIELQQMARLSGALLDLEGCARFELEFDRDAKRRARVRGVAAATLQLECQRCLDAVSYPLRVTVHLVAVGGLDEAAQLPEECSPLLNGKEKVRLGELIEDELLLALPLVPMHPAGACTHAPIESQAGVGVEATSADSNPFAALAALKHH